MKARAKGFSTFRKKDRSALATKFLNFSLISNHSPKFECVSLLLFIEKKKIIKNIIFAKS